MPSKEYGERFSHGCLAVFLSEREMFAASKRDVPKTPTCTARHHGLSLARSCAIASETPCVPGHIERKTDLRNDRFRVGNGGHLTNRISLIANCHRPLRLPYVCLESGARNSQK